LRIRKQPAGQIIVEYILLLVVAVTLAVIVTRQLVSRDPDDSGIITKKWSDVENAIGSDLPD